MPYSESIADRIREALMHIDDLEEKHMFGGVCFMVNGKMCIGVVKDDMMCRIDPAAEADALERTGARPMDFTGRPMKGYIYVDDTGMKKKSDFQHWINLCLEYNTRAKASKKKK